MCIYILYNLYCIRKLIVLETMYKTLNINISVISEKEMAKLFVI